MAEELEERRREFELRIDDLRESLAREFGWAPRAARWVLPVLAGAAGLAAGIWLRRARRLRGAAARRLRPRSS